jgi:hypothetical protein
VESNFRIRSREAPESKRADSDSILMEEKKEEEVFPCVRT